MSTIGWIAAANDVGVYDLRWADRGSNVLAKGHDGFTPVGPRLVPAADLDLDDSGCARSSTASSCRRGARAS